MSAAGRGLCVLLVLLLASAAWAGRRPIKDSEHWPCDDCHPVGVDDPPDPDEEEEQEHDEIVLRGHDRLGKGNKACFTCHHSDDTPEVLNALGGETVPIEEHITKTCDRCHMSRYREWKLAIHGKGQRCPSCHDPHSPNHVQISLSPFGPDEVDLVIGRERKPFEALPHLTDPTPVVEVPGITIAAAGAGALTAILFALALVTARRRAGEQDPGEEPA